MAITIPTPEDQGAKQLGGTEAVAANTPYQNIQLPDLSFNSKIMQQLGSVMGSMTNQFREFQQKEALLEVQRDYNDYRNGIYNPVDGALTKSGADAVGLSDRVALTTEQFSEEMRKKYGSRLGPSGMLALETMLEQGTQNIVGSAISHETAQRVEYQAALAQSNIDSAIANIGMDPTNQRAFDENLRVILSTGASAADMTGSTGGNLDVARDMKLTTAAVGARVAALAANGDNQAALDVLDTYRGKIDPETYGRVVGPLRDARDQKLALDAAEVARIVDETGLPPAFIPMVTATGTSGSVDGGKVVQIGEYGVMTKGGVVLEEALANQTFLDAGAENSLRAMLTGPFQQLQRAMGMTIVINDALPTEGTGRADPNDPDYNPNSQHWNGAALDIDISNMSHSQRLRLVQTARSLGFNGFGFGNGYMHIDMRKDPAVWGYGLPKGGDGRDDQTVAVNGWNGLNLSSLRAIVLGAPAGTAPAAGASGGEYINTIADPKIRADAQKAYAAQLAFDNSVKSQQRSDLLDTIYAQVETDYASGTMKPTSEYLTAEAIKLLGQNADDVRAYIQGVQSGGARVTDQDRFDQLVDVLTTSDPARKDERFAAATSPDFVKQYRGVLSVGDYRTLTTLQATTAAELRNDAAELKTEHDQAVWSALGNASRATITDVLGAQITAYSGVDTTKDRNDPLVAQMTDRGYTAIRGELSARLSSMSPQEALTYAGEEGKAAMQELITQVAREYLTVNGGIAGENSSGLRVDDDVSMLQLLTTIDDSGVTTADLLSGATSVVIPTSAYGDIPLSPKAIEMVSEALGPYASPSQIVEATYALARGYMAAGDADMLGKAQDQIDAEIAAARAATGAAAPESPLTVRGGGDTRTEPTPEEITKAEENPLWRPEAFNRAKAEESLRTLVRATEADPNAAKEGRSTYTVPQTYNMLLAIRQQLAENPKAAVPVGYGPAEVLLRTLPIAPVTYVGTEYTIALDRLSGSQGATNQSSALDELISLYEDTILE